MNLNRTQQRERRDRRPFVSFVPCRTVLQPLGVCLLLAGTVFAAGSADPETPRRGGTLRVAWRSDPQYLDPALVGDYFNVTLARLCYHGSLDYDDGDNLVPWLAEAMPPLSAKPRSAIGRWLEPTNVAGLKALDRYTLRIQLEQPEPPFLFYLTMPFCFAVRDAPWLFLFHPMDYRMVQPWVKGFRMPSVWQVRYDKLWIDK